jgi:hypothetical protein
LNDHPETLALKRWPLVAIVAGAVVARLALMANGLGKLEDPDNYLDLARSLVDGHGFSLKGHLTAYRPPLYPLLLAPLVGSLSRSALPFGVGMLHLILGVGTVLLTHGTARRWGLSPVRGWIAASLVAFDPVLIGQARLVMTETLAAFLVSAILWALTIPGFKGTLLGGLGLGLASLCRPSFLPVAFLASLVSLVVHPGGWRVRFSRSLGLIAATLLTLLPWAYRNARVFDEPVWTTTHGGFTLALANNEYYYADVLDGPPDAVWGGKNQQAWKFDVEMQTAGMSEPEADRFLRSEVFRIMAERPRDFLRASIERFKRFWGLAPSGSVYPRWLRWTTAAWTAPVWLALALGLCRRSIRSWPEIAAVAFIVALSLVHLAYWTDMSMRAPLVPAIALIAAGAHVKGWWHRRLFGREGLPKTNQSPLEIQGETC